MTGLGEAPRRHPRDSIALAAALGLASGLQSAVMFKFEFDPIFWTGLADQEFLGLRSFPYPILIALCFTGVVAVVIRGVVHWRCWTPLLLAGGIYAAWMLAVRSAIAVNDGLRAAGEPLALATGGAVAGLIGAGVTALTVMAVAPRLRSSRSFATVALAGLLAGPLLVLPFSVSDTKLWPLATLFMTWQAAVTTALAWRIRQLQNEAMGASAMLAAHQA